MLDFKLKIYNTLISLFNELVNNEIPEKINETKSLKDFEVISGATYTCNRIMEAILKALEGAKK